MFEKTDGNSIHSLNFTKFKRTNRYCFIEQPDYENDCGFIIVFQKGKDSEATMISYDKTNGFKEFSKLHIRNEY